MFDEQIKIIPSPELVPEMPEDFTELVVLDTLSEPQNSSIVDFVAQNTIDGYENLIRPEYGDVDMQREEIRAMVDHVFNQLREVASDPNATPEQLREAAAFLSDQVLHSHDAEHPVRRAYRGYKESRAEIEFNELAQMVRDPRIHTIADIGVGAGYFSERLAALPGKTLVTTDILNFRSAGKDIPFVMSSADRLPFKDETIDALFFMNVLHHTDPRKLDQTIAEAARVLRRGPHSKLFLLESTLITPDMIAQYEKRGIISPRNLDAVIGQHAMQRYLRMEPQAQWRAQALTDWYSNRVWSGVTEMPCPFGFLTISQWEDTMKDHGLTLNRVVLKGYDPKRVTKDHQSWLMFEK